ncbi:MAG: hypothetical protein ACI3VN_00915 [Candidatus Onthomonas sp.]
MEKKLTGLKEKSFAYQGSIVEVFAGLSVWPGIRSVIDRINANAVAA